MVTHMNLHETAQQMVATPKGILAADESTGTAGKRLASIGMENTEENRRKYRELLFTTPGLNKYISGVILFEETLFQKTDDGTLFVDVLTSQGILPGIKTDQGLEDHNGEQLTKGLETLAERSKKYAAAGARFAKWRAVIHISESKPSEENIRESAKRLATYAKISQEANLVPIVEPEVLMEGNHTLEQCSAVTKRTLTAVFSALHEEGVDLQGIVLKPNMIVPGKDAAKASPEEVAQATVAVLKECVPKEVPGIAFLSGGIGDEDVTQYLNMMNKSTDLPWKLTFSFGRGLQRPALSAYALSDVEKAQKGLLERAAASSKATLGTYE